MLKRITLAILLTLQALGGGAISLAHARDVVVAPPGFEASHTARCAILHDVTIPERATDVRFAPEQPAVSIAAVVRLTAPARAPPPFFS